MKFTFIALVPMIPLLAYPCGGRMSPDLRSEGREVPARSPAMTSHPTGFPVVPSAVADPERRGPSPFSRGAILKRSAGWSLSKLESPRWWLMMTDHFALRGDASLDLLREAGVVLEEGRERMRELLGGDDHDVRFSARLFRAREEFHAYATCVGVPEADSFYHPGTGEVVVCLDRVQSFSHRTSALLHEFAHQYVHRIFGRAGPLWLVEGIAEHAGAYRVTEEGIRIGEGIPENVALLRRSLEDQTWIPLSRLLSMEREEFYGRGSRQAYAQSWLVVRHLMTRADDVHENPLLRCIEGVEIAELIPPEVLEGEGREFLLQMN